MDSLAVTGAIGQDFVATSEERLRMEIGEVGKFLRLVVASSVAFALVKGQENRPSRGLLRLIVKRVGGLGC